ncbi:hemicentin-2-like, partial [Megalops cyprinoides]|uniref:hemicentin-2-like n=1 Tax=Megalops cyprinoides TaxID=118141 RepID=UPI001863B5B8
VSVGECPVQLHPSSLVVRYGDLASANCTVSEGHLGIGWEASEGSVDMVQDVQFVTWRVENLTDWHIEPKCFGNFNNTGTEEIHQCVEALQVTLYKTPDSVSISSVDHTGPMVEGRQYQLQCEVQNIAPVQNLTVKWYRGEILERESSFNNITKTPMNVSSTLTITPSRADDGAQYSCVAELELRPEGPQPPPEVKSEPLKITVHYKPSITKCPNQEELREGDSLGALLFITEGNPSPRVTWYRDQSEVNSSTPLTRKDSGQYVLTARNSLGSTNCTFSLTVGYAPELSCDYSYEVTETQSYTLNCTAEGYPAPEVTWMKQGEKVELPAHLGRQHAGLYTLIANNTYGTVSHTLEIKVLYKPSITKCPNQEELREGDSLGALLFITEGNPSPRVTWYRDQSEVNSSTPLTRKDSGQYILTARNSLGSTNCTFSLTVGCTFHHTSTFDL